MTSRKSAQHIPRTGPEREALREKGQFWTPDWVAEAMVANAISGKSDHVFDPAVGAGAFFRAAKTVAIRLKRRITLVGTEVYPDALREAQAHGLSAADLAGVQITDFILNPPSGPYQAIVANPPYIRHHRLSPELKTYLKVYATRLLGHALDGRAGLHVFFLLRALQLLGPGGRLAFIMPADSCEGVFAPALWRWITQHYALNAVVTFEPDASPFPGVDTNAVVFMLSREEHRNEFSWVRVSEPGADLLEWAITGGKKSGTGIRVHRRSLSEGLSTGLSRAPRTDSADGPTLGTFASVLRGIATGANEFFFLTVRRASELGIPSEFLLPAIGRVRDADGDLLTVHRMKELEALDRPTLLLSLDGRRSEAFPSAVRDYLRTGETMGLPLRVLIASRRPWYKMERRRVPPYLFAYLGRRNARFVLNEAGVVPLTGFLCVYPHSKDPDWVAKLWRVVSHPKTVENLRLVGKSYGGGAIKVEPRALERLPLPPSVMTEVGLTEPARDTQLAVL